MGEFQAYAGRGAAVLGEISLDRDHVCRPLRRFWRFGFPSDPQAQFDLAWAIFVIGHEVGHADQRAEGWHPPAGSGTLAFEYDADCRAARAFREWAKRFGVIRSERTQLVRILPALRRLRGPQDSR
jgi:hypothetical protein